MAAFTYPIEPNSVDSHQTDPGYCLTFLRWSNRDTQNFKPGEVGAGSDNLAVRGPLTVVNDCISVITSHAKNSPTPKVQMTLLAGDINYMTAISPGDFVLVNMVNFKEKAMEIRGRALTKQPINKVDDGFKGVYRVQKVDQTLIIDPVSGKKKWAFNIQAHGFMEWTNKIYFNRFLNLPGDTENDFLFITRLSKQWASFYSGKEIPSVQKMQKFLMTAFLGLGLNVDGTEATVGDLPRTFNQHFKIPPLLGSLLGVKKAKYAIDIYDIRLGIEKYGNATGSRVNPRVGLNPANLKRSGRFLEQTGRGLLGRGKISADYWVNVPVWSILKKYLNSPINEIYTSYKLNPEGFVMPTVTVRQKPFTSQMFGNRKKRFGSPKHRGSLQSPFTRFMDLPRWKINPDIVYNFNTNRTDALRFNFVQVQGRTTAVKKDFGAHLNEQFTFGNYDYDKDDIKRSGLRPYLLSTNFDFTENAQGTETPKWARLVSDWVIGGHLKLNGKLSSVGIVDPLAPGDNLEFGSVVFHIESVSHSMVVRQDGSNAFRTNLTMSHGLSKEQDSTIKFPVYGEMVHTDAKTRREEDYNNPDDRMLPGFSDTQDLPSRAKGEEGVSGSSEETKQFPFTPRNNKRKK